MKIKNQVVYGVYYKWTTYGDRGNDSYTRLEKLFDNEDSAINYATLLGGKDKGYFIWPIDVYTDNGTQAFYQVKAYTDASRCNVVVDVLHDKKEGTDKTFVQGGDPDKGCIFQCVVEASSREEAQEKGRIKLRPQILPYMEEQSKKIRGESMSKVFSKQNCDHPFKLANQLFEWLVSRDASELMDLHDDLIIEDATKTSTTTIMNEVKRMGLINDTV